MKAFLMYRSQDFNLMAVLPPGAAELTQDLELDTLFASMSARDPFLLEVAKKAVLNSLQDPETILYRQQILADCLERPAIVREMYGIAVDAIEREKKAWGWMSPTYPEGTLHRSVELLRVFMALIGCLRRVADAHRSEFRSDGFQQLFAMFTKEFSDDYLRIVDEHIRRLAFRNGILMSAELGEGNRGTHYIFRKPVDEGQSWMDRVQDWLGQVTHRNRSSYVYEVDDRDESGLQTLSELRGRGIAHVASALAQSADHILGFFKMLRLELGFYVGCMNLRESLARKSGHICFPQPAPAHERAFSSRGLYDACLCLSMEEKVVPSDVVAQGKTLVMITGANRGGKSTFLRSVGLSQLMMQCGMFVPAQSFLANVCSGIFTHFKREEDAGMKSGKLDEELFRMSSIVENLAPNALVLLNESFASTNEREGSEIARQIVRALLESGTKVFYVTHMFDLANGFCGTKMDTALFLRAERLADGRRTFRLAEGEPLPTSYGKDLYWRIFGGPGVEARGDPSRGRHDSRESKHGMSGAGELS
jgi:hypothetical protein